MSLSERLEEEVKTLSSGTLVVERSVLVSISQNEWQLFLIAMNRLLEEIPKLVFNTHTNPLSGDFHVHWYRSEPHDNRADEGLAQ